MQESSDIHDLKKLLLSIDEEEAITRNNPTRPVYRYSRSDCDKQIIIAGNGHVFEWEKIKDQFNILERFNPDILLHEGTNFIRDFENLGTPEEILDRYGEQGLMIWWAVKNEVPFKSWDLTKQEEFEVPLKETPEEIIAWVLYFVTNHFWRRYQRPPHIKDLQDQLTKNIGYSIEELQIMTKLDLSPENLDQLGLKFGNALITQSSQEIVERNSSPRYTGVTNDPYRKIRERREENAIREIVNAKEKYDKIFVSCGTSHAVTWKPVIEAMYPENF